MSPPDKGTPEAVLPKTGARPDFDMIDSESDIPLCEPLRFALLTFRDANLTCGRTLVAAFDSADKSALRNQRHHEALCILAAVFGTTAVLFAIVQLSGFTPGPWPMWIEVLAAVVALFAVVLGFVQSRQDQWLLQRHKAERYRLLKFRLLADTDLWRGDRERWKQRLDETVQKIEMLTRESLKVWLHTSGLPGRPPATEGMQVSPESLSALVGYYEKKRLRAQQGYFEMRASRNENFDRYMRKLPPIFFFGSSVAVLMHFSMDLLSRRNVEPHTTNILLITAAASLPVLGAGVRTFRSAHEFARNTLRYRAQANMLAERGQTIVAEIGKNQPDANEVFYDLWCCEEMLESEHREWLSLMTEAEWFL